MIAGTVVSHPESAAPVLVRLRTPSPYLAGVAHPNVHTLADLTTNSDTSAGLGERNPPSYFLRETWAEKDGSFGFGELHAGKYGIVTKFGEIDVELVVPQKGHDDSIAIESFEGCVRAKSVAGAFN